MLRFEGFELDDAGRTLRGPDGPVHLEPQAFDLLVHLARHRDRVVSKQDLLDEVWGHRFVGESALTTRIKEIRRAVGDDGHRQAVVANVRGRGYRFVADVVVGAPASRVERVAEPDGPVGRDDDVDAVVARLDAGRLVTVVGPGGVGKTTLAREVARRWQEERAAAVWVALAEITDGDAVVAAVAEALGVMADDGDALAEAIAARSDLLVLDNCEHVADAVAALLEAVLERRGTSRLLATSRERLGTAAEQVRPLHPLDVDDGRALFLARASAAGVDEDLDPAVVDRIVGLLDGLPLALEMAAAQLGSMGLDDLDRLVRHRLDLLRAPSRSAPRRHRTLRALVGWSLDLLEASDRDLLGDLTAFTAPVAADDVAAVLAGTSPSAPTDAVEASVALAALADRSLLTAELTPGPTRYAMAEVVRSAVDPERRGPTAHARRHAEHFIAVAVGADAGLRGADEAAAHLRLTAAVPELRAAHRWASEHDPAAVADLAAALHLYCYSRLWAEPVEWARATDDRSDPVLAALLAADAANRSRLPEAEALARDALASGDERATTMATEVLADLALYDGRLDDAVALAEELCRVGVQRSDHHLQIVGLTNVALVHAYSGDARSSTEAIDLMADLLPALSPSDRAWCRYTQGEVAAETAPAAALGPLTEAIALGESVGNRQVASVARTTLASAHHRLGELGQATDAFHTCLREALAHGNHTHATTTLRNVVGLLVDLGDDEGAADLLAALHVGGTKATWGPEADRLEAAEAAVGARARATPTGEVAGGGELTAALRLGLDRLDGHRPDG